MMECCSRKDASLDFLQENIPVCLVAGGNGDSLMRS
jgi:hypothetical protein